MYLNYQFINKLLFTPKKKNKENKIKKNYSDEILKNQDMDLNLKIKIKQKKYFQPFFIIIFLTIRIYIKKQKAKILFINLVIF